MATLEREVFTAERGFEWGRLAASAASMSLFASRKMVELRIPSGKPGTDGANAISAYCARLPADTVTIVTLPRLDRAGQTSAWFAALARSAVVVNVYPVERKQLPLWIGARLARHEQRAGEEALAFIADRVEGNLLAAHQEIQKLALLYPAGELTLTKCATPCSTSRASISLSSPQRCLPATRDALRRVLAGLAGEGEPQPRVLWVMAEDIRAAARVERGLAERRALPDLMREHRIWGEARQRLVAAAARRIARPALEAALAHAAEIDRMIKGLAKGEPWDELLRLGLRFVRA